MAQELDLGQEETEQALDFVARGLPPLTNPLWLPFLFGVSPKIIGAMIARSDRYYRRFRIKKRAGGVRALVTPRRFLKTIQRWILHNVLAHFPPAEPAHGFVPGRGIFSNARAHLASRNLLALDIENFFPSVKRPLVEAALSAELPYGASVISQISGLCTLAGELPQGAPTSPAIANLTFRSVDVELSTMANDWKCNYTRYADDLAISGVRTFTPQDVDLVEARLAAHGFSLNRGKTRISGPGRRQVVAGIVVNEKGLPPRPLRRRWRAMFHRASNHPHEFTDRTPHLAGVASFVNQYDPELAQNYFRVVAHVVESGQ